MKKKMILILSIVTTLLFLVACGSDDSGKSSKKAKEGLNSISYDALIKKLKDRDTFYLVTLDARPELLEEKNIVDDFDEEFKNRGMKVFFVNLYDVDDAKKKSLSEDYLHTVMSKGSGYTWDAWDEGFVYVENGRVVNLAGGYNFSEKFITNHKKMVRELQQKVDAQFIRMKENGIEPKVE